MIHRTGAVRVSVACVTRAEYRRLDAFYVYYRKLNKVTVKNTCPLPLMDSFLDSRGDPKTFSDLDAILGYWKTPMPDFDNHKYVLSSHSGLY